MTKTVYGSANHQTQERYLKLLNNVLSASRLYSESSKPYLDYRIAENVFCKIFGAENLSRSGMAIDAKIGSLGIGIKTFVNTPYQKIAEFDKDFDRLNGDPLHDAKVISELRNARMKLARDSCGIESFLYHYIVRKDRRAEIYEEPMEYIDTKNIKITESSTKSFHFLDGKNEYIFNKSKSTLLKNFSLENPSASFPVRFLEDPLEVLFGEIDIATSEITESIVLPLFSTRGSRHVPIKSGLNQWNAGGRARNPDEVYIAFPKNLRKRMPNFFPPRYTPFKMILPDGTELSASICQDDGKALMSNPNKALGHWILRTVLHLKPGELATIEKLDELGIDAVIITKHPDYYRMDFTYIGSSENEF